MASIMTSIELQDRFSTVMYSMINAANLSISAMYDMREAVEADTSGGRTFENSAPVKQIFRKQDLTVEAIRIPIEWKTNNLPVFTGLGIEQLAQEIQSADQMLSILCDTQREISQQAESTVVFSLEVHQDLDQITSEIETIRSQIARIGQNSINIGAGASNVEMERLRGLINSVLGEQQALNRAVESMSVKNTYAVYKKLSETVIDIGKYIWNNMNAQGQFYQSVEQGQIHVNNLMQTIKQIAATYISIEGLMKAIDFSDQLSYTKAKLDMMNDGMQTTKELQDMIFFAAERSRGSYMDMGHLVAKLGNIAKDAFGSTEEIVAFSEQLNKHVILAGASVTEMQDATLRLVQALACGVLRGDELNSIFEQAPTIIQAIADYMNVPVDQIRELGVQGQITSDLVKNAMFMAADETNAKFASMPKTFEQIGQSIQNQAIKSFEPVFTKLNELANSEQFQEMVDYLVQALAVLANVTLNVLELMISAGNFIAEHWNIAGPVIMTAVTALLLFNEALTVYNGILRFTSMLEAISIAHKELKTGATIAEAAATDMAAGAQVGLNAAMMACPIMWVIAAIAILIGIITAVIIAMNDFGDESTTAIQKVCGAFAVAGAFIGNLFVSLINFIIDDFAMLWNYIALFANFLANVFTDPIGAIARLFFGLIDLILSGIEGLAHAFDTLFGSNLAEAVAGWRTSLDGWVTDKFGEGKVVMEKVEARDHYIQGFDHEEAWNKGTEFGGKFGGSSNIPGMSQYDDFDYSSYLTDISDNTEDIKEGLEVSEEDLKFMRDIAEQEAVNRFTTASITIEQTNHNNVSGSMDLDGMITGLTDAVSEAADVITEGVHE